MVPARHNAGMLLKKGEFPVLAGSAIYIPVFTVIALRRGNAEFLLYAGIILVLAAWILWKQRSIRFDLHILWGLSIWGFLHMAGGNIPVGDGGRVLYSVELIRIYPRLHILRFDQMVHAFGFGVATLACYHLLRPFLKVDIARWGVLALLVVLLGSGLGALNEIVEFIAVLCMPETGVGGYENTLCDLVFNLIGSLIAVAYLTRQRTRTPETRLTRSG